MANASDYLASGLFDHIFSDRTFSKPSNIAIALTSGVLNDSQTGATIPEMANANGYARVPNASGANFWTHHSNDGPADNKSTITFPQASADWDGTVSGVVLLDSKTYGQGNVLVWGYLSNPQQVLSGNEFKFNTGNLDISIN